MTLREFLNQMQALLKNTEFIGKTYLVGGVVRDHLLGQKDFYDFDLVVEQRYGGLKLGAFMNHRVQALEYDVFPKFGTARMDLGNIKIDFVESRRERYKAGRRYPMIRYGSIQEDYLRRDFSINSLYMDLLSEKILDPSGIGIADLRLGLIRTLRDADKVFAEDLLRILRAIRFAACLDFTLHEDCAIAIAKYAHKLTRLSATARNREYCKMQTAGVWDRACALMQEFGIDSSPSDPPEFKHS